MIPTIGAGDEVMRTALEVRASLGQQRHSSLERIGWHSHMTGYAAVVLAGGYWEAGDEGRHRVEAGDVLLHFAFDGHWNGFGAGPSEVLNLPLPERWRPGAFGRVADPDRIARVAERDMSDASRLLVDSFIPGDQARLNDWPDGLAAALRHNHDLEIGEWARHAGLAPETVSRKFKLAFGLSPVRYRRRQRARSAWPQLMSGAEPLAELAVAYGFADQAHMTHELLWLTGKTPGAWRSGRSKPYKIG
jgi:AraC-like DNA-binding protein